MYNQPTRKKPVKKVKKEKSKWIKRFWIFYVVAVILVFFLFVLISYGHLGFMPSFADLENPKTNLATEVYSADGELLGKYYLENRSPCKYDELPPLGECTDCNGRCPFLQTFRGRWQSFSEGFRVMTGTHKGGGSTITQQLAKNLFQET